VGVARLRGPRHLPPQPVACIEYSRFATRFQSHESPRSDANPKCILWSIRRTPLLEMLKNKLAQCQQWKKQATMVVSR